MSTVNALPPSKLRTTTDDKLIPWEKSSDIPSPSMRSGIKHMLQPRAIQALELGLSIQDNGYNIYLSGGTHLGRSFMVQEFLAPHASKAAVPSDMLYLNNFIDRDKPLLLCLPAGHGRKFKKDLQEAMAKVRKEMPMRFEADFFISSRAKIIDAFQEEKAQILKKMNAMAKEKGFSLDVDDQGGLTLYPLVEDKRLSEDDFENLDAEIRQNFKRKADALLHSMAGHMRRLARAEQESRDAERDLERQVAMQALENTMTPFKKICMRTYTTPVLEAYFDALTEDILSNLDTFLTRDSHNASGTSMLAPMPEGMFAPQNIEPDMSRYDVNLFVDNSDKKGAPVIFEDHPTANNLLGCIERESEMGALITDFRLIKAGSIHKANGGYLIIRIEDILQHFHAWEGMLRAMRTGIARIEDIADGQESSSKTKGLEPQTIPLQVKIILIGTEALYETLLNSDERFAKLFHIKAHLSEQTQRNAQGIKYYLQRIQNIVHKSNLLPLDKGALAWMVDYGSSLIEDQRKLSLKFPLLREILIEASALATKKKVELLSADILEKALEHKTYRANLVEDLFMEEYDREFIKVRTSGSAIGQVNGLSVSWHGDFEFGLPHQISCTVGVGHGGIIDLEREAELGGPIHTKAMMILKSYLVSLFARRRPIVLTGSLCFEQSYAGIEGDSASGAELVALLSAIAEVPVRLDLAFTGALSQSGQIMAVGGVTRKIEGFFKVCARHGLTGTQGVLIPHDNVEHLMLSPRVVEAVSQGKFAIYAIKHIDQALELLTGMQVGKRNKRDGYTINTLYDLVDKRLQALHDYAQKSPSKGRRS